MTEINICRYIEIFETDPSNLKIVAKAIEKFYWKKVGLIFMTQKTVAKLAGVSINTVRKMLRILVESGRIIAGKFRRKGESSARYFYKIPGVKNSKLPSDLPEENPLFLPQIECANFAHKEREYNKEIKINKEEEPAPPPLKKNIDERFGERELVPSQALEEAKKFDVPLDVATKSWHRFVTLKGEQLAKNWARGWKAWIANERVPGDKISFAEKKRKEADLLLDLEQISDERWGNVKEKLLLLAGKPIYINWIRHIFYVKYEDGVVTLSAPSKFVMETVQRQYQRKIDNVLGAFFPGFKYSEICLRS